MEIDSRFLLQGMKECSGNVASQRMLDDGKILMQ